MLPLKQIIVGTVTHLLSTLIKFLFGYCSVHGWFKYPKKYRMNTKYKKEANNYAVGCKQCKQETYKYYNELEYDYLASKI